MIKKIAEGYLWVADVAAMQFPVPELICITEGVKDWEVDAVFLGSDKKICLEMLGGSTRDRGIFMLPLIELRTRDVLFVIKEGISIKTPEFGPVPLKALSVLGAFWGNGSGTVFLECRWEEALQKFSNLFFFQRSRLPSGVTEVHKSFIEEYFKK